MKKNLVKCVVVAMIGMGAINANAGILSKLIFGGGGAAAATAVLASSKKCADPEVAAKSKLCQLEAKAKEKYQEHKDKAKAGSTASSTSAASSTQATKQ